jgi:ABC-2 type transport system permease protein
MTTLTGTWALVRLSIRRDRVRLIVWIAGFVVVTAVSAASLRDLYPTQAAIDAYVHLFGGNPALVAFGGPGYGFDRPNIGVVLVNETQLWGAIAIALMNVFLVNRSTRAEEDAERTDLIRSLPVGRHAPAVAATLVVTAANLLVGTLCATAFVSLGYATVGSIALAGSFVAVGMVFTGLTVVTAEVAGSGRATIGIGSVGVIVAFVLRAVGDIGDNALRWLSPIGWAQGVRPFAGEHWWTLALCAVVAIVLVATSFQLSDRRDLGAGLIHTRPGHRVGSRSLSTSLGLAWRLQRGATLGWLIAMFLTGAVFGSIATDVDTMISQNPQLADVFAQLHSGSVTDSFFATTMMMLGLLASGYSISAMLVPRAEEHAGRAENLLAAPLSRRRWLTGHLLVAVFGSIAVVAAGGLGVAVAYAIAADDAGEIPRLVGASLVTVPAVLVLLGGAAALYGLAPRAALVAWAPLVAAALVGFLGELLRIPEWARRLSPFERLPRAPAEALSLLPIGIVTTLAVVLVVAGFVGLVHRDISTTSS